MLQIVFGKVMFISSLAVDRTFGEWLRVNIKFAQAVDYNMGVNVACAVFTIGVSTDQMLIGGFVIFMIPQVVGSVVVFLELAAATIRQVWYI